jgi:RHS repeat-associated protein
LYFQDGLGSTSHVSDAAGNLTEYYRYTSFGIPNVYSPTGALRRNGSTQDVRHLFTGQLWMPQTALYDYRNRVYSPSLTRFLQPDPLGFGGDPSNLYRYCGNNSVNRIDPSGLVTRKPSNHGKPPPQLQPNEPVNFGSNGYTPLGSHIPQNVFGIPNGSGWDLSSHDYVNGWHDLGTFLLLGTTGSGGNGSRGDGGGGGAYFVRADLLLFGSVNPVLGTVYVNGHPFFTSDGVVNALLNAAPGSITSLTFAGHGDDIGSSAQVGYFGSFLYTSNGQGGYNFSFDGHTNINSIFSSLSAGANVNFFNCNTATGDMNLSRAFSLTFPGTTVTGFRGDAWAVALPYTPVGFYYGTPVTYRNGEIISGGR